jgi:hypothetical protein
MVETVTMRGGAHSLSDPSYNLPRASTEGSYWNQESTFWWHTIRCSTCLSLLLSGGLIPDACVNCTSRDDQGGMLHLHLREKQT